MARHIVIVENPSEWIADLPGIELFTPSDYLAGIDPCKNKDLRVVNLARDYRYLSLGYYCSLLGEARKQKLLPSIKTLTDLSSKAIYALGLDEFDKQVKQALDRHCVGKNEIQLDKWIFFGRSIEPELQDVARILFGMFPCPILQVNFRFQGGWQINTLKPANFSVLKPEELPYFKAALIGFIGQRWTKPRTRKLFKYDLAVLHNPSEQLPPSDKRALNKFIQIGKKHDVEVELITKSDYDRLAEYDALFIRETTAINHHTYKFAKKAESEGMAVIDDPESIVRCTNKVYLWELLSAHKIPTPRTEVLKKKDIKDRHNAHEFPVVLKIPDGSFSRGVHKAENLQEFITLSNSLFNSSALILSQEFMKTDFDWRVGILNSQVIFVCKYFVSKAHWQILKHESNGKTIEGTHQAWRIDETPPLVIQSALAAARLIGAGLYGVDIKQTERGVFVIEVNDNPNIDVGVEDGCVGDELYSIILRELVRRVEMM